MSRVTNFLLILGLWVAIYLPALGSLEIKGEEGRRILPALTMIDTGNYLVPQVGSQPYYRKPPLVNWLVAFSFQITGHRNEWSARLPSALAVLALAIAFLAVARASLGADGSLVAALVWLTSFGIIEKGRLIEIEALYVSLVGLALICWISFWHQRRSPWLIWLVPSIFLGLGLLAKGPVHLLFFYAVIVAILYLQGEVRELFRLPHLTGIAITCGIFAAWAIPYWQAMQGTDLARTWTVQVLGRLSGDDFKLGNWLLNIPRGLGYFLPWALLLPLTFRMRFADERDTKLFRALALGCAVPFLVVNLLPGALPRYSMPAMPGACWLMAMTLGSDEIIPPRWWPLPKILAYHHRKRLVVAIGVATAVAISLYAVMLVPLLQRRAKVRPIAAQIDALVPESETLYAVDPDYQPFLFYIRSRVAYVDRLEELPPNAQYLLVQPENEQRMLKSEQWAPRQVRSILSVTDYRNHRVTLAKVGGEGD